MLSNQSVYILKCRTKIGAASAFQYEISHIAVKFFLAGNHRIIVHIGITLYDMQIHFAEKVFLLHQNIIGFLYKLLHQCTAYRA